MPDILEIAARHGLKIIEDCALSVGARYGGKHTGLFGDAGCFSFYPIKHITTGEGGMFVSRYKDIAESVSRQRAFGVDRSHSTSKTPGIYDVIELGLNYRMSEMQAALGRKQVLRLNEILERRKKNFLRLKEMILGIPEIVILDTADPEATNSHYCLSIVLKGRLAIRRAEIVEELNAQGVGTSIYYPQPVPRMTYYRNKYGYDASVYPNAEAISDCSIALPVGPHLAVQDVEYIGETVVKTLKKVIS
jgi:dTDP-4-amino-4,6-dideoxygalactose transaminase